MINKNQVKNILISRTDRLGDAILALPLIGLAGKIFPNAKITFLVSKINFELIKGYKGIDELLKLEEKGKFIGKYKFFRNRKIDMMINVNPRFDLALLFYLLGIKFRIGTGYRWYSFLYNYKVYEHRKTSDKHEADYNLNLLNFFFKDVKPDKQFYFNYSLNEKENLNKRLADFGVTTEDEYIIVHPGSSGSAKDLPVEKHFQYLNMLLDEIKKYKIVFTGLENETEIIKYIIANIKPENRYNLIDLSGQLDLKELLILIDHSKLFISNSTGPIHIAGALNKNILGFYPRQKPINDIRWKPLSENAKILMFDQVEGTEIEPNLIYNTVKGFLI